MNTETEFIESLDEKELIAYNIAKNHLGTMFILDKCNAFIEWLAKNNILPKNNAPDNTPDK